MRRAFTLTELVVVVAVLALLLVVLTPSIQAARSRSDSAICLSNLRTLGQYIRLYADQYDDCLPGGCHPAVYHNATVEVMGALNAKRILTWKLREVLGDMVTDRVVTCPTMSKVVPDWHFTDYYNHSGKYVYPVHYALNNYGSAGESGPAGSSRHTDPPHYFGYSAPPGASPDVLALEAAYPPLPFGAVPNADREWMIADAWYRSRSGYGPSQEGPYQEEWSGAALPYFAPHGQPAGRTYRYTSDRLIGCANARRMRMDGFTNALLFDGHAAGVVSRVCLLYAYEVFYGFPGTVNPKYDGDNVTWQ
ncbi:MAG: prepilin-type N-terminal cleavage/methylation domain-containing protein [Phycisphaerae bacterium]|nr:prepilin-type N-terminal cleavage/methylation domain-containing protein [Phycisphaerae bacterium]